MSWVRRLGWDGVLVAVAALAVVGAVAVWRPVGVGHWVTLVLLADLGYLVWRTRAP
mgnify:CR=1 FL=1